MCRVSFESDDQSTRPAFIQVLMFMYDITNNASFIKLNDWYTASNYILTEQTIFAEPADKFMTGKAGPFLALIGNKCMSEVFLRDSFSVTVDTTGDISSGHAAHPCSETGKNP